MFSIFPKNDDDQTLRIKRFLIAFGAYLIWNTLIIFTYLIGLSRVPLIILASCVSGNIIANILIYTIIRTGLNKRFKDPSLTLLQMVIATFWIMLIVYYADASRSAVLLVYLVVLVFGLFRLNVRQFLFLSVFAVANYSAIIFLLYKIHPESLNMRVDILNIVVLAIVLPWFSMIGGYFSSLRSTISKALSTIERLTNNIQDVIFVTDMNLKYTYVSPSVKILRGYEPEEVLQQTLSDAFASSSVNAAMKAISEMMELEKSGTEDSISRTLQLEINKKDGSTVWTETKLSFIIDKNQRPVGILGVVRDITRRKQMEEELRQGKEKYQSILENIQEGYFEVDLTGRYTFFNDSLCRITGCSHEELLGANYKQFSDKENVKKVFLAFNQIYKTGEPAQEINWQFTRKDGSKRYIEASASLLKDSSGKTVGFKGMIRDITERKRIEKELSHMATHDVLTGLPNRFMFSQALNQAIQSAQRHKRQLAVLFIDLDRFKTINDSLGHDAGDQLLKQIARRFKQSLRSVDVIGRLGGDEFIIMIEELSNLSQAATVAQKILTTAIQPITLMGEECRVTASIGISIYPRDGEDGQSLMKNADSAMYFAKEEGKNNYQFYSKDIQSKSNEHLSLETNLRLALEREEFYLQYQAKVDFKTGMITGVEALLRWQNHLLGSVTPTQFLPVVEETGLIVPIGRWVIKTVCAQNVAWQRQGLPPVCVSVNLSLRQLTDDNLLKDIKAALNDSGMAPNLLELEITESMVMHNHARLIAVLAEIKKMGVRLAIDNFGTGYSSIAQIKHFPIDTLKVDRSFIRNIPRDSEDKAVIESIINMGKHLSLTVVAEGVETQVQDDFLRQQICDEMQGFYFSKPVDPDKFADLLRQNNTSS